MTLGEAAWTGIWMVILYWALFSIFAVIVKILGGDR